MSKSDIRNFFGVKSKSGSASTKIEKRKIVSSEDDEETENKRLNGAVSKPAKKDAKKRRIIDSDDEDEPVKPKDKNKPDLGKLKDKPKGKEVDLTSAFGKSPVKRVEQERRKKPPVTLEIPSDDEFEKSIVDLDDNVLPAKSPKASPKKKPSLPEKKTPAKSPKPSKRDKSPEKKKSPPEERSQSTSKASPEKKKDSPVYNGHTKSPAKTPVAKTPVSKKPQSSAKKSSTKKEKPAVDLETSVQMDEARFERKQTQAILYQKFKNRPNCLNPGSKEIPKGRPNCLAGKIFLATGVLESLERQEAEDLIKEYGGKVVSSVTKKLNFMVVGEEAGPAKLAKAEEQGVKMITEDDLLDMIRGGPAKPKEEIVEVKKEKVSTPRKEKRDSSPKKEEKNSSPEKKRKEKESSPKKEKRDSTPKKKDSPEKKRMKTESPEKKRAKSDPANDEEEFQTFTVKKKPKLEDDEPQAGSSKSDPVVAPEKPPVDTTNMAWVDKYKPTEIKQIIGQQGDASNTNKLLNWLKNWHSNHDGKKKLVKPSPWAKNDDGAYFKAALLSGPPGIGKTTTATLVCRELGYDTVEFNASDTRSKRLLKEQVSEILKNKSLFGYMHGSEKRASAKHVLLMDEVDGMAGNEDRGGMQELIALIKDSSIPIICMCNDRNHQKMRSLVNYCFDLRFQRPRLQQIKGAMMSLCCKENMKVDVKTIEEIITASNNDIRQTINYLAMLSAGKDLPSGAEKGNVMKKDLKVGPWEVVRKVFSAEEHKTMSIHDKADLFFQDYSMGPLFVQENYLQVLPDGPKDEIMTKVAKAASSLSRGDLIERRIRTNNNWSVLPVQAMFSSVIPGEFMAGKVTGQINFPGWLGKNSRRTKRSRLAQEIHDHTRVATSGSRTSIRMEYAPHLLSAIVRPLKEEGVDGVPKALEVMREYRISREDIDALIELTSWPGRKNPMDAVESKVKAALTRAYNKEALAFVPTVNKKSKTAEGDDEDLLGEEEEGEVASADEEEKDKLDNDAMIKQKKKASAASGEVKGKGKEKKKEPKKKEPKKTSKK